MHHIRLASSGQDHLGCVKCDEQYRLKKNRTTPHINGGEFAFEIRAMLISQDQVQQITTLAQIGNCI